MSNGDSSSDGSGYSDSGFGNNSTVDMGGGGFTSATAGDTNAGGTDQSGQASGYDSGFGQGSYGADVAAGDSQPAVSFSDTGFGQGSYGADLASPSFTFSSGPTEVGLGYGLGIDATNVPAASGSNVDIPSLESTFPYQSYADILARIRGRESVGVAKRLGVSPYALTPQQNSSYYKTGKDHSEAAGAYQFQPGTWQQWASFAGIDTTQFPTANTAPPPVQDYVATLAIMYGPGVNSSSLWKASAPPGGYPTQPSIGYMPGGSNVSVAGVGPDSSPTPSSTTPKTFFGVPVPSFLQPRSSPDAPSAPTPKAGSVIPTFISSLIGGGATSDTGPTTHSTGLLTPVGYSGPSYLNPRNYGPPLTAPPFMGLPSATPGQVQAASTSDSWFASLIKFFNSVGDFFTNLDKVFAYLTIENVIGIFAAFVLMYVAITALRT